MSESLRDLLYRAEHGKAGKRGYVKADGHWRFFTGYRDKTELIEGGFKYYLWDYLLMEKRQGVLTLYSWDSATTRDRLETISDYYSLPLRFITHEGELCCKPLDCGKLDEWRYNKIVVDTIERTIKIYIENERGDIEKYNY